MKPFPKAAIEKARVLVVGDVMLDRYWFGEVERISPEAPVPVVHVVKREDRLGGAANVARNVAALGAQVTLVGLVGQDEAATRVTTLLTEAGVQAHLVTDADHPTTLKMRVLGRQQQLLRIDFEEKPTPALLVVRVAMIRAGIAASLQDGIAQRQHLESILEQSPEFAGLIAQDLLAHYTESGDAAAGLALLHTHYQQYPSLDLFNVVFRAMRAQQNATSAWAFARASLQSHPSLLGLDRFLEAELAQAEQEHGDSAAVQVAVPGADLALLRTLIHRHTQRLDRYVCRSCGFQARRYYWQCPGCNAWETYKPRRLEEIE